MKKIKNVMKRIIKFLQKDDGFTMIELIIVIAIIGTIATLVATNVFKVFEKQKVAATKLKIKNITQAIQMYGVEEDFPETEEGLVKIVESGYLKKDSLKDPWKQPFNYRYPSEIEDVEFQIWSYGADKKEGGTGVNADITNWE